MKQVCHLIMWLDTVGVRRSLVRLRACLLLCHALGAALDLIVSLADRRRLWAQAHGAFMWRVLRRPLALAPLARPLPGACTNTCLLARALAWGVQLRVLVEPARRATGGARQLRGPCSLLLCVGSHCKPAWFQWLHKSLTGRSREHYT